MLLLLVTIALVLTSTVLLIVGFVQDTLSLIYLSITTTAAAAVALVIFSRLARRRATRLAAGGVAAMRPAGSFAPDRPAEAGAPASELPVTGDPTGRQAGIPPEVPAGLPGSSGSAPPSGPAPPTGPPAGDPRTGDPTTVPAAGAPPEATGQAGEGPEAWEEAGADWGEKVVFPIADYDSLRVNEIIPLLPELDPDELQEVRDRESAGKRRTTVLNRIDHLLTGGATDAT